MSIALVLLLSGALCACNREELQQVPGTQQSTTQESTTQESAEENNNKKGDEIKKMRVNNNGLLLEVSVGDGILLESIYDQTIGHEYIMRANALFEYMIDGQSYTSADSVNVISASEENEKINIQAESKEGNLRFSISISKDPKDEAALLDFQITNTGDKQEYVVISYPKLLTVKAPGPVTDTYACVPQEIGWVGRYDASSRMGFAPNPSIGLPTGLNVMEVLSVYNKDGLGGIFIADTNGAIESETPPVNFSIDKTIIEGRSVAQLSPGQTHRTAIVAIGLIRDNDWHAAVDYYNRQHRQRWSFPDIPDWLRESGAVYSAKNAGAGGCYMLLPELTDLKGRIGHFLNLPKLLKDAQAFGTNVVFVSDFYDKADITGEKIDPKLIGPVGSHYWNKGDYIPREDLGGAKNFKKGIAALHEKGGRIFVYVEPYITLMFSKIGREFGEQWAARNPDGVLDNSYPYNYTMCAALEAWRAHIRKICVELVEEYDVDGIFLDSMGWQWNHNYMTLADNRVYSLKEYNDGFLAMTVEVREAIKAIKPDAVVLSETGGGPLSRYNDGGWTADFAWGKTISTGKILASPLRYGIPEANIYSNGKNINELQQVYAAGFGLAMSDAWVAQADYIKKLVDLRVQYKDALIYGRQTYQPKTLNSFVAAYVYEGEQNNVITVVNTLELSYKNTITLRKEEANTKWIDALTDIVYVADEQANISVDMPGVSLMVLHKVSDNSKKSK